jgi:hypothetical protein
LSVKDGKLITLHDGSHVIHFNQSNTGPFFGTGVEGRIRLNAGFVSYAGSTYYFPANTYSGPSPGGVFLKIEASFSVSTKTTEAPFEPWSVMPFRSTPQLVWRLIDQLGDHAQLTTNVDDPETEEDDPYEIQTNSGTLYIPIAAFSDGQVLNFITRNIFLLPTTYGPLNYRDGW